MLVEIHPWSYYRSRDDWKGWVRQVVSLERLHGWKVNIAESGGGWCCFGNKTLYIDKTHTHSPGMFLHEVAHALRGEHGHDALFADILTRLIDSHCA